MEDTISHELVHAFDHCTANVDWFNLEHYACSEVFIKFENPSLFFLMFSHLFLNWLIFGIEVHFCVKNESNE